VNRHPEFLVLSGEHCNTPMHIGPAIHVELVQLQLHEGNTAAVERMSAIVSALAETLMWDQQRRLGAAIGYQLVPEPHPGAIPAEKVLP
jgi:hypothetical protein